MVLLQPALPTAADAGGRGTEPSTEKPGLRAAFTLLGEKSLMKN